MPRPVRTSVLVVGGMTGALLAAAPAHAAPLEPVPVYESAPSAYPVVLRPLSSTAAGTTYRTFGTSDLWIKPTGAGGPALEQRIPDADVVGDLIQESFLMDQGGEITWRTTTDATLHQHVIPPGLYPQEPTDRGYIAREAGSGDLVRVDVLDGDVSPVGTLTADMVRLTPGPQGVLSYGYDGGELRYFPYATPGAGRRLAAQPAALTECPVVTATSAYCTRDDGLARYPLAGGAATTVVTNDDRVYDMVPFAGGVGLVVPGPGDSEVLKTWAGTSSAPVERLGTTFGVAMNGGLVATEEGTSVVVSRGGDLGRAGLWSVTLPAATPTQVVAAPPSDRVGTAIALGPGSVAWVDNARVGGSVWTRGLAADGTPSGSERLVSDTSAMGLSVAGGRVTYHPFVDGQLSDDIDVWEDGATAPLGRGWSWVASASGDRLVLHHSTPEQGDTWSLYDVRTGASTALPEAADLDLWGERLARLDRDGRITVEDLRTGKSVVVREATPGDSVYGSVHVAGDTVAWDVMINSDWSGREVRTSNLSTTGPAEQLGAVGSQPDLEDLSTGHALAQACIDGDCGLWAIPLDGSDPVRVSTRSATAAVDGRTVAFVSGDQWNQQDGTPSVVSLPAYADAPRLLAHPEMSSTAGAGRTWALRVVTSRVLSTCSVQIHDASDTVVRTLPCLDPLAAAEVGWDGTDDDGDAVVPGEYTWHITGATGDEQLVDYDGGRAALSGAVTVSDDPAPAVTGRTPAADARSQPGAVTLTATFSEAVTGVSGASFELRRVGGEAAVAAAVRYDAATRRATLDPSTALAADTLYEATLTGGASAIRDLAGGALATTRWRFLTGPAPAATKFAPTSSSTAAGLSGNVAATFSEPVDGVAPDSFRLRTAGGTVVPGTVTFAFPTRTATFDPSKNLLPDTRYTATLTGGADAVHDLAGNPFATRSWSFTTGPAPTVTGRNPASGATKVSRTANVVVAFGEPVVGVSSTTVRLRTSSGSTVPARVAYSTTSRKATLNPSRMLAAGTRYTVAVTGGTTAVRDKAGNPLKTATWSFTTGS